MSPSVQLISSKKEQNINEKKIFFFLHKIPRTIQPNVYVIALSRMTNVHALVRYIHFI